MDQGRKKIKVLFVCTGNICRSPMAEALFTHLVKTEGLADQFYIDSAGTTAWESGEPVHPGTQRVLQKNQIPLLHGSRARMITPADLQTFDYIVGMTREHISEINRVAKPQGEVRGLLEYASLDGSVDVPDPYYTGGFDYVYDLINAGCYGLLEHIRRREQKPI
ncbi:MAG: low molecular weight phosphotyrosine protein phosphatase [Chloroflexaceae bacterium]|nr:low molecular weight phosphotyrosine protein phosphatase [Chloroflexaceae bacterium]